MMTLAFVGTGNMSEAILAGAVAGGFEASDIVATARRDERATELKERYGVKTTSDNADAVSDADVVILGVKPYQLDDVLDEIGSALNDNAVVVSVAVGRTIESIQAHLPKGVGVVRVMPNTPAMVGAGMHVMTPSDDVSEKQFARVESIFAASGEVMTVPENQHDAVAAVSGSGPAYIFYIADAMTEAGVLLGLQRAVAAQLAAQTILGAGTMLTESGESAVVLREKVSSPGGTTITALAKLDEKAVRAAMVEAMKACAEKSASMQK